MTRHPPHPHALAPSPTGVDVEPGMPGRSVLPSPLGSTGPAAPSVVTVHLPSPPSVNNLFGNRSDGRGRYPTKRYKAWREAAGWHLKMQRPQIIRGRVRVSIALRRPKSSADVDNFTKAPIDLLVTHGVIEDDRYIDAITARWDDKVAGCVVEVAPSHTTPA